MIEDISQFPATLIHSHRPAQTARKRCPAQGVEILRQEPQNGLHPT
jgi:hypothetical protein